MANINVISLINIEERTWDERALRLLITPEEVEDIMQVQLPMARDNDKLI